MRTAVGDLSSEWALLLMLEGRGKTLLLVTSVVLIVKILRPDMMPEHSHGKAYVKDGLKFEVKRAERGGNIHKWRKESLKSAGRGEAHNNVPPYIALYFCKKL